MKLKKHFSYTRGKSVWRLLINNENLLLVEERDTIKKEVSYQCFDLTNGKHILKNYSPVADFWVGVEDFTGDMIYFHTFRKPDMPWHKDIIAYSLKSKTVTWQNNDLVFGFKLRENIYAFKQTFDGAHFFALDAMTGAVQEEIGENNAKVSVLKGESERVKDYSAYGFPSFYTAGSIPFVDEIIRKNNAEETGEQEYIVTQGQVLFTLHKRHKQNTLEQVLYAVDLGEKKIYLEEVINKNEKALLFDSFFTYREYLIVIRDKIEILVYKII